MKIVTVEEMRRIEAASDEAGHSYAAMMERAGRAVAGAIIARWTVKDRPILVLVGPGNNGGDGLVAARYLVQAGARVTCYLLKPRSAAQDKNVRQFLEHGDRATLLLTDEDEGLSQLARLTREADGVMDALLGTGVRLPLRGRLADILNTVENIRAARRTPPLKPLTSLIPRRDQAGRNPTPFVVAVDGPSGLAYDTGALDEAALPADLTVTFAYPKPGHFRFPGAGALGELIVADIGTAPSLADGVMLEIATPDMVRRWLPARPLNAHKGTFGRALAVAGSVNYTGAAYLTGAAAARAGAGLVTLALPAAIHGSIAARLPEATYLLLPHTLGVIAAQATSVLSDHLEGYDALLLGPGLGQEKETVAFVKTLLSGSQGHKAIGFLPEEAEDTSPPSLPPLIVDADGLNILAQVEHWERRLPASSILTPHPGEMARLMGNNIQEVESDRVSVARSQAAAWGQVIVLKGAHTVVAAPDGRTVIQPFANPGLATAGSGDVLAGVILALRAQGRGPFEAAAAGAYLHGLAGHMAREEGIAGMIAGDILAHLQGAWKRIAGA